MGIQMAGFLCRSQITQFFGTKITKDITRPSITLGLFLLRHLVFESLQTLIYFCRVELERGFKMNLQLQSLFEMQNELDRRIERDRGLENEDLIDKKILALQVEVGELANETRCFKFWSSKAPSDKEVILEEFVDGLHFLLSLGIILPYDVPKQMQVPELIQESLVDAFLKVYEDLTTLKNNRNDVNNYVTLMEDYLMIGRLLGFTAEEVNHAYLSKNEVNHTRQDQGY